MRIHLDVEGTLIPRYGVIEACRDTKFAPVRKAALANILALRKHGVDVSLATSLPQARLNEIRVKQLLLDLGLSKKDVATALTREKCAVQTTDPKMFNLFMYKNRWPNNAKPVADERASVTVEDYNYGVDFGSTFRAVPANNHDFLSQDGQNRIYGLPFPSPGGHLPLAAVYIPALYSSDRLEDAKHNYSLAVAGRIAESVLIERSFPFPKKAEHVTRIAFEGDILLHLATDLHLCLLASADVIKYLPDDLQRNIRNWQTNGRPKQHFLIYIPNHEQAG